MFALFANVINGLLSILSVRSMLNGPQQPQQPPITRETPDPPAAPRDSDTSRRCKITIPERINAHFFDTGSPAWAAQTILAEDGKTYHGIHGGTDFGANAGTPVYAPKAMTVVAVGRYTDAGRMGSYIIGNWDNGYQYYTGHLDNVTVRAGARVECGDQVGVTNIYNHTHIQLKNGSVYLDPEKYLP